MINPVEVKGGERCAFLPLASRKRAIISIFMNNRAARPARLSKVGQEIFQSKMSRLDSSVEDPL